MLVQYGYCTILYFGVLEHITWCGVVGFSQPSICVFIFLVQPAWFVWQAICTLYHDVSFSCNYSV